MIELVSYMLYFFAAIGILFGLVSLSVLLFYAKNQTRCRTLILLRPEDSDAELIVRTCIRSDRLLSRGEPPIVIDCGLSGEPLAVLQRLTAEYRLTVVHSDKTDDIVQAVLTPPG